MFSQGQIVFGILFAVAFIAALIIAYNKDKKVHKGFYKGSIWVLIAFISFIIMIALIKQFLG
ncbi:MAG: hypothetical protein KJO41_11390 [Bacteroidia bacterium]|nr:hypothetical protein [Bacteroidia bacterium]NND25300.1 hypothetical protein [Flavobacteriaceae bacterium]MBT8279600.1 hypothetical protein [Bacteroidia bacterium]NNK59300.1 hypothetical protein [Flavobacteriaceae bacterium]NNL34021.1 hypothetical protein [Flavobacteriaceae bacterium]